MKRVIDSHLGNCPVCTLLNELRYFGLHSSGTSPSPIPRETSCSQPRVHQEFPINLPVQFKGPLWKSMDGNGEGCVGWAAQRKPKEHGGESSMASNVKQEGNDDEWTASLSHKSLPAKQPPRCQIRMAMST